MTVALIYKKSAWELFSESSDKNVSSFISQDSQQREAFKESHTIQKKTIDCVEKTLTNHNASIKKIYRSSLSDHDLNNFDLVITVGGDGTFLESTHYVTGNTPIVGVNSDPSRSVGFFCACNTENFADFYNKISEQPKISLSRLSLSVNEKSTGPPILNDILFANPNPAATTRYKLNDESYRNSGLLASTAAGSTAWTFQEGVEPLPLGSQEFQFIHRGTRNSQVNVASKLEIHSLTRKGTIFIDGDHCSIPLYIGQKLKITSGIPIIVIGDINKKRAEFLSQYD